MYQPSQETSEKLHAPFELRKLLVLASLLIAAGFYIVSDSFLLGLCVYCVSATILNGVLVLTRVKASWFVDPAQLFLSERVTPAQLDRYFESRWLLRLTSCSLALASGIAGFFLGSPLEAFAGAYGLATLLGIVGLRAFSKEAFPKVFHIDLSDDSWKDVGSSYAEVAAASYALTGNFLNPYASGIPVRHR